TIHLLPTLWFRNTWSWGGDNSERPLLHRMSDSLISASHPDLGDRFLHVAGSADLLFTENETNAARVFHRPNGSPYVKDAFHEYLVNGRRDAVNPDRRGTKAAAHHAATIEAGG